MDRKVMEKPIFSKKIAKNLFQRRKNEKKGGKMRKKKFGLAANPRQPLRVGKSIISDKMAGNGARVGKRAPTGALIVEIGAFFY